MMKFRDLAIYIEKIEQTSSRLTITHLLSDLYKKLTAEEISVAVYLLQGRVAPLFEKIESGMAEKMVIKSVVYSLNLDKKLFENKYKKLGDLGKTVEYFKKEIHSFDEKDLSVTEVYQNLYKLATAGGSGSQEVKIKILANLVRQLDPLSCRYLVRIPQGVMRLGFSDMTVLDALSWMIKGDKSLRPEIEKAYHVRPDLGEIAGIIKKDGISGLEAIKPKLFTPILMMRAERLSSSQEIIEKIGRCAVESKYDGFRLQVHYSKKRGEVRLYSRNLEEVSFMYPDIVSGVKKSVHAQETIFEGEAIGLDIHTGELLPFQETVQRKRKYEIEKMAKKIPLKLFVFEMLYLNGKNYLTTSYSQRRQLLAKVIKKRTEQDTVKLAPETIVDNAKKLELLFDEAISHGLEGIIAKKLDGVYQPGARGWNWIKFKRSYSSKIEDTIDCLVMGFDFGKGKRAGFGIGAFLVGVYDEKNDKFVTMAKIGTGLSDNEWRELRTRCDKYRSEKQPALYEVDKMMTVDTWIKPSIVVEIKADEITRSPVHTAKLALRFPRLQKFRDDKRPEEVTTLKEVEKMFREQIK